MFCTAFGFFKFLFSHLLRVTNILNSFRCNSLSLHSIFTMEGWLFLDNTSTDGGNGNKVYKKGKGKAWSRVYKPFQHNVVFDVVIKNIHLKLKPQKYLQCVTVYYEMEKKNIYFVAHPCKNKFNCCLLFGFLQGFDHLYKLFLYLSVYSIHWTYRKND